TGAYMGGILHPTEMPGPGAQLIVSQVVPGSPADRAGIGSGAEIVALSDSSGVEVYPLTPESVTEFVRERGGQDIYIGYRSGDGEVQEAVVQPAHAVVAEEAGRP